MNLISQLKKTVYAAKCLLVEFELDGLTDLGLESEGSKEIEGSQGSTGGRGNKGKKGNKKKKRSRGKKGRKGNKTCGDNDDDDEVGSVAVKEEAVVVKEEPK